MNGQPDSDRERRPNFFIVGAPKAGTTSMYSYLAQHPDVYLCPVKEPNHFSFESISNQELYYEPSLIESEQEYLDLFRAVRGESAIGEASVSYLYYEEACLRLAAFAPDARILIFLRNPVDRAFSHFMMDRRLGLVDEEFEEIVDAGRDSVATALYYQQYVSLGLYTSQVRRYLQAFGPHRVCITFFEDLQRDPLASARRIFHHLGVDTGFEPDVERVYNPYREPRNRVIAALYGNRRLRGLGKTLLSGPIATRLKNSLLPKAAKPTVDERTRARLTETFRPDIEALEELTGRSLEAWRHA